MRNLCQLIPYLPKPSSIRRFNILATKLVEDRKALGTNRKDIFTYLYEAEDDKGSKLTHEELNTNSRITISAGSDTSSAILACVMRMLAIHPEAQQKLFDEVSNEFTSYAEITAVNSTSLPYTNAVVNEGLRLWSVLPAGPQSVLEEGMTIAGVYIPKNTSVKIPSLALMRDERYFLKGDEFIPERWIDQPGLVLNPRAFIPFSYGSHICVGKQLALNVIRLSLCKIIRTFEVSLGSSYNDEKFFESWKDYNSISIGPFPLEFVARKD